MVEHMLTTSDNPFNPFTQWNEWYVFDTAHGYHSASYLARVLRTSNELSDADQSLAIEQAIDEIIQEDVEGVYMKITEDAKPIAQP